MTYEFEYLLHLLGCAVLEKTAVPPKAGINWDSVFGMAKEQTVYPMVLYLLRKQPELLGDDKKEFIKQEARVYFVGEELKRQASYDIINSLENADITPVVLKGYSLSHLYPEPTMRQSADLDLYVGTENEKNAQDILRACGVCVQKRGRDAQEAVCHYAPIGHIELHAWLLGKEDREAWLSDNPTGITQPLKTIELDGGCKIHTLGDRDNLFFLTIHFVKHFVKYGANLRNLIDVALFYRYFTYRNDVDWFWKKMEKLCFDNLVRTMLSSCVYYLGFSDNAFHGSDMVSQNDVDAFLTDLEMGGWMGNKEKSERYNVRKIYDRALYDKRNSGGNWGYLWKKRFRILEFFGSVACSKEHLCKKYPYVQKSKIWLALGYLNRSIDGFKGLLTGNIKPIVLNIEKIETESEIVQRRIDLFKKMGLL